MILVLLAPTTFLILATAFRFPTEVIVLLFACLVALAEAILFFRTRISIPRTKLLLDVRAFNQAASFSRSLARFGVKCRNFLCHRRWCVEAIFVIYTSSVVCRQTFFILFITRRTVFDEIFLIGASLIVLWFIIGNWIIFAVIFSRVLYSLVLLTIILIL